MSFDQSKFTNYVNDDLVHAQELAKKNANPQISPIHLAVSMLREVKNFPYLVCQKAGVDVEMLKKKLDEQLQRLPKQDPVPEELYISAGLSKVLKIAQDNAVANKDSRVAQDHLMVVFNDTTLCSLFESVGLTMKKLEEAIKEKRGNAPADSDAPEGAYDALNQYGIDLVKQAEEGKIDPVIGRDEEIRRVIRILCRRTKNNPVLIGEPGVGKTAIVEGLANRIVQGDVPETLRVRLVSLDLGALIAGAKYLASSRSV